MQKYGHETNNVNDLSTDFDFFPPQGRRSAFHESPAA